MGFDESIIIIGSWFFPNDLGLHLIINIQVKVNWDVDINAECKKSNILDMSKRDLKQVDFPDQWCKIHDLNDQWQIKYKWLSV